MYVMWVWCERDVSVCVWCESDVCQWVSGWVSVMWVIEWVSELVTSSVHAVLRIWKPRASWSLWVPPTSHRRCSYPHRELFLTYGRANQERPLHYDPAHVLSAHWAVNVKGSLWEGNDTDADPSPRPLTLKGDIHLKNLRFTGESVSERCFFFKKKKRTWGLRTQAESKASCSPPTLNSRMGFVRHVCSGDDPQTISDRRLEVIH